MNLEQQWCNNRRCADYALVGADNIRVLSHSERRYYCVTCEHTFSFDQGTAFETLRTPHEIVCEALLLLTERNSLRAVERVKQHTPNRLLYWLDVASAHVHAVSDELIRGLHLSQVQIDELWTFVKKSRRIAKLATRAMSVTCGFGVRSRCPADCASRIMSAMNGMKQRPVHF